MNHKLVYAFACLSAIVLAHKPAHAYCTEGLLLPPNTTSFEYPVYLVAPNSTIFGLNRDPVAHRVRIAMDNWNEEGASNLRAYFGGIVDERQEYSVNVHETSDCSVCEDSPACEVTSYWVGSVRVASDVFLEHNLDENGNNICRPDANNLPWTVDDVYRVVTHELGHSWGLEDEYEQGGDPLCEGTLWDSAMSQTCSGSRFITRRDVGALQSLYGRRQSSYLDRQTTIAGWSWGSDMSGSATMGWSRLGSLGTTFGASEEIFAQARFGASPAETHAWRGTPGAAHSSLIVTPNGDPETESWSWDVAGAARKSSQEFAVAVRSYETEINCSKGLRVYMTTDGGDTFTPQNILTESSSLFKARGEGVSIAYDPVSDVYVVGFVATFNLYVATCDAESPHACRPAVELEDSLGSVYTAKDYPAVACNSSTYLSSFNCMLAWQTRAGSYNQFLYAFAEVDPITKGVVLGAVDSHLFQGWQSPSLAAVPSATYPFVIAIKQYETIYAWRYDAALGSFVNETNVVTRSDDGVLMGVLGVVDSNTITMKYAPLMD